MRPSILRLTTLTAVALTAGVLSACASTGPGEGSYASREQKLSDDCAGRGGILAPTGASTGRPETENVCKINGEPSRLTRSN